MMKKKLIKTSTIAGSLNTFCRGQLKMLSEHYEVVAVSTPGERLENLEEREGVRTIGVPMERHIAIFKDFVSLIRMIMVFAKERPQFVHSMTPKAGLISMLAAWITRVPVRIHTFTGLVWPTSTGMKRKILMFMDRLICGCATYINPEGNGVKQDLKNFGITKKPLHIIANGNVRGVDLEHYSRTDEVMTEATKIRKDAFTFVFIGRLVRDKGINELVSAFTRLYEENNNIRLLLVGTFEEKLDPLEPQTVEHIKNHLGIDFVGRQNDVRPWLVASDVFTFPSYREGFPNVVLEAGAMGLPSIVTDINGSNEIITQNENGVIVPVRNVDAMYESMRQFSEMDATDIRTMGDTARQNVVDKYDYHIIWDALLRTYRELSENQ